MESELTFLEHHRDDRRAVVFPCNSWASPQRCESCIAAPISLELLVQVPVPYCEAISQQLRNNARAALNAINRFPVCEIEDLLPKAPAAIARPPGDPGG